MTTAVVAMYSLAALPALARRVMRMQIVRADVWVTSANNARAAGRLLLIADLLLLVLLFLLLFSLLFVLIFDADNAVAWNRVIFSFRVSLIDIESFLECNEREVHPFLLHNDFVYNRLND